MLGSIVVSLDTVLDPGPCYETINDNVLVSDSSQVRNLYYIKKNFIYRYNHLRYLLSSS